MDIALVGSRWFGAQAFRLLAEKGHAVSVLGLTEDDQLTVAARAAGVPLTVLGRPRRVVGADIPGEVDVIVAAHSHSFIMADARAKARRAAIGFHPSLLPRHRGIAAVEWTMKCRDPIAGGTIYHLTETMDGGAIAAQEWCFVYPDDDAASLWRRALAPMGLRLLMRVIDQIEERGYADAAPQDEKAATAAPMLADASDTNKPGDG
jgi:methionyl-tRNA formyltransferase